MDLNHHILWLPKLLFHPGHLIPGGAAPRRLHADKLPPSYAILKNANFEAQHVKRIWAVSFIDSNPNRRLNPD